MKFRTKLFSAALAALVFISGCDAAENNSENPSPADGEASLQGSAVSSVNGEYQSGADSDGASSATENGSAGTESAGSPSKPSGGNLSASGNGYEGTKGTGDFNYGEALQKSLLFYELQRSGDIDESTIRTNWRGDSGMSDGSDAGLDLTGGLYDAGDNVKFNLPMAYTSTMLAWSVYEDRDAYEQSGQLDYALANIKWICDYLIKCHPEENVYYYQVGDGNADHAWWGPCEVMQMARPSYKVDSSNPGSTVAGEAAAALASCAAVYKDIDKEYSETCLTHAKQLYNFADSTKSDAGYTAANGFYNSWSGFYDELTWAAVWLNLATGDGSWLDKAKEYEPQCDANPKWALCWDNKSMGAICLLAKLTGDNAYKNQLEECLDWWSGNGSESITYSPKGLAWLDQWGSLRYATTMAMVAASYAESGQCPADKAKVYQEFCENQVNYALGSSGRSFVVGFGENPPEHPHHRTAQGSWADNMNEPGYHRHTLFGALVGGPDSSDGYSDTVSDYNKNEVADDYNAGFTGALAKMYKKYGGETLIDFGAVEDIGEEMYVEYRVNASGDGFTEIKALVYNQSGWPARVADNLELRYFADLSELSDPSGVSVNLNYGEGAAYSGLYEWDKDSGIYYVSIDFSGSKIYPGGQSAYKKEVQFRMSAGGWNPGNDPSYKELQGTNGSDLVRAVSMGLYENGTLVFGTEPDGSSAGNTVPVVSAPSDNNGTQNQQGGQDNQNGQQNVQPSPSNQTADRDGIKVSLSQQQSNGSGNTIGCNLEISNGTGAAIDLSTLEIDYFFTADGKASLSFWCDHAAITGGGYTAVTDSVKGAFSSDSGSDCDTKCAITFGGGSLSAGDVLQVQMRITASDWSNFDLGNDFSSGNAEHLYILQNGTEIFGSRP